MVAHRSYPAGSAGCRWLMSAAATAAWRAAGGGHHRISPSRAGPGGRGSPHARSARIPDRSAPPGTSPSPPRTSGSWQNAARTSRSWRLSSWPTRCGMPLLGPAIPGHGSRSGSACSSPGPASCARSPTGQDRSGAANARLPRRDRPRTAPHPRAQRPVGLHHAQPDGKVVRALFGPRHRYPSRPGRDRSQNLAAWQNQPV